MLHILILLFVLLLIIIPQDIVDPQAQPTDRPDITVLAGWA